MISRLVSVRLIYWRLRTPKRTVSPNWQIYSKWLVRIQDGSVELSCLWFHYSDTRIQPFRELAQLAFPCLLYCYSRIQPFPKAGKLSNPLAFYYCIRVLESFSKTTELSSLRAHFWEISGQPVYRSFRFELYSQDIKEYWTMDPLWFFRKDCLRNLLFNSDFVIF